MKKILRAFIPLGLLAVGCAGRATQGDSRSWNPNPDSNTGWGKGSYCVDARGIKHSSEDPSFESCLADYRTQGGRPNGSAHTMETRGIPVGPSIGVDLFKLDSR